MPATRGTRRGNGPGHGGPAKGEGYRFKQAGDAVSDAARSLGGSTPKGEGKKARTREILDEAAPLAAQLLVDLVLNPDDPRALSAANSILAKTGFHDKSGVEHTGGDGGPLVVAVRKFYGPLEGDG